MDRRTFNIGLSTLAASAVIGRRAYADTPGDLIDKAKKEGAFTWYTSDTVFATDELARQFQKAYGIGIEVNRKTTLPLVEQFTTEVARGGSPADVVTVLGMGPVAATFSEKKVLASYVPPGAANLPANLRTGDIGFAYTLSPMGVSYNTNLVKPEEVALLRSYKGWLDPRFAGRMAITAPIGGTTGGNMLMLQQREGIGFIEALIQKQKAVVYQTVATVDSAIVAGEQAIGLNVTPGIALQAAQGAPVRYIPQDEWTFVVPAVAGISATASHPNAARLFMNWLFTPEVQKMHANVSYWIPVLPGIKPDYPKAEWLELPKNPVSTENPVEFDRQINSNIANWRKILGW